MNAKPLTVLLLFSSADIGGAERSLSRMAFSNTNPMVSYQFATFGSSGKWSEWIASKSIKPHCFNYKIWPLLKYIYLFKPDIIYILGFRLSVLLRFVCVLFSKSILVQGVRWNPNSNSMLDRVFRLVEHVFSFLLDGYIANSNSTRKVLSSIVKSKVELIYNGISLPLNQTSTNSKNNNVITIANLSVRKGHKDYLKVISEVVKRVPNSQFIFLGYDNLNGEIQKLIVEENLSSNVQYLGFQENVEHFLARSSIFVLPSKYGEGCPTSILEAFSYKLPVVAYQIDGIPELVSNNVDGILVDVGDNDSLANAIEDLLLDSNKAENMGNKGYLKIKENFLLTDMIKQHNAYFLGLK